MDQDNLTSKDLRTFISLLAGNAPAPGGGGGAALIGAAGAALGMMTASLTVGKPKYAAFEEGAQEALKQGMPLTGSFLDALDRDAKVWNSYMKALQLPRGDKIQEEIRRDTLDQAARDATRVPLDVLRLCREATNLMLSLEGKINPTCASDLGVGAAAISAAAKSSWINILINLKLLSGRDDPFVISAYAEGNRIRDYVTSHCDALYERTLALYQIW